LPSHSPVGSGVPKDVVAGEKVGIAEVKGGGDQAADVDLRTGSEQDAVGVDHENLAVGAEAAQYLAGVLAEHAVERDGGCAGLVEAHRFVGRNAEALPVDGEILAALVDGGVDTGLRYRPGARADLSAGGPCQGQGAEQGECPDNASAS